MIFMDDDTEDKTADEIWEKYIKGTELESVLKQLIGPHEIKGEIGGREPKLIGEGEEPIIRAIDEKIELAITEFWNTRGREEESKRVDKCRNILKDCRKEIAKIAKERKKYIGEKKYRLVEIHLREANDFIWAAGGSSFNNARTSLINAKRILILK